MLRAVAGAVVATVFVLPLAFVVSGSLRDPGTPPPRTPELLPGNPTIESYGRAFELVDLARQTVNSLVVATLTVPLAVLVASLAGFAFMYVGRRSRRLLTSGWSSRARPCSRT
jgi:multiple sugar transport system permease protein